jgi:protein SCO1/2
MDGSPEPRRSVFRSPFVWAFLGGIILLTLIRPLLRHEPAPPPVLGRLPAFSLTAASGEPFGSAELSGQVYVASFFFSRCPSICPRLMAAMGRLQQRYDEAGVDGVRLISITVDPDHDTPERLREYGAIHNVEPRRWTLLTGDFAAIRDLVREGFRTPLGQPDPGGNLVEIAHSTKFVLVDGSGAIRGYYDSDTTGLDEIFHRSRHVLKEMRR